MDLLRYTKSDISKYCKRKGRKSYDPEWWFFKVVDCVVCGDNFHDGLSCLIKGASAVRTGRHVGGYKLAYESLTVEFKNALYLEFLKLCSLKGEYRRI